MRLGRWEQVRLLGRGGMGEVGLARDPASGQELGIDWVSYRGERIPCGPAGEARLRALSRTACRARMEQSDRVRRVLLATGDLRLVPNHTPREFGDWSHELWMQLREELRRGE